MATFRPRAPSSVDLIAALTLPLTAELRRTRAVAQVVRLAAAVVVVAATPLAHGVTSDERAAFAYAVALGWVPVVGALGVWERRRDSHLASFGILAMEFGLLLALGLLFDAAAFVLATQLLVVVYHAYVCGVLCAAVATVFASAVGVAVQVHSGAAPDTFSFALYPVVLAGITVLMVGVTAERRHATSHLDRQRLKAEAILTGVAESVVVTSPRGTVRQWNDAAERSFACPGEVAVGRRCEDVLALHREVGELDCTEGCALLAMRLGSDDDLRVWRTLPTGERQPLLAHVSPLLDDEGAVVEVVHSFRDISGLVRADEAKNMFLATASHELKTPLTVIMGFAELLQRNTELRPEDQASALDAIQSRTRQLSGIVDRLLLTSRLEAGRIELNPEPVPLAGLLAERTGALGAATGRDVRFEPAGEVVDALADLDAVATIVDHLLDNAVKYSQEDGGAVVVRLGMDDEFVTVAVSDEGIGMTPEQVEHCFERFWQAETGDGRRFGGTGIGLYIVSSFAEAMKGRVDVESTAGAGTTFTLSLPRADRVWEGRRVAAGPRPVGVEHEPSIIREFMSQLGVPGGGG